MTPAIDYKPLSQMENIEIDGRQVDFSQSAGSIFKALSPKDKFILVIIVVVAIAGTLVLGALGILLALGIPAYVIGKRLNNQKDAVWRQFAETNGWSTIPSNQAIAFAPPSLASTGHSKKASDAITGNIGQIAFKLFNYQYTIGSGKDAQTFTETVFTMQMDRNLPEMFLRSHKGLQNDPRKGLSEKLNLEGDFNKFYRVFSEPGREVDDLVILTPDVMQFLIDSATDYCVEIYSSTVAVYSKTDVRSPAKLPLLIDFSLKLYSQILENLPDVRVKTEAALAGVNNEA